MLKFTKDHEWLTVEGDIATVGITDFAQKALGDVVFIELPTVGKTLAAHADAAVVESVKAASDVYAPVSGTVTEINDTLVADSSLVNSAPHTTGWFFKLKLSAPAELDGLMDQAAYDAFLQTL